MILFFNRLKEEIATASNTLFVSHRNPDPDTVGSALAMGAYAESLGKETAYFCADRMPDNFLFLRGAEKFSDDLGIFSGGYDLVIFMDCAELSRSGVGGGCKKQRWISIDHHPARDCFADWEIRDAGASSTCEIIYKFLLHANSPVGREAATALLSGLLIDTSFLSNAATNDDAVRIAGELISLGADYRAVIRAFHSNKSPGALQLWGLALNRLKYDKEKNSATTAIFKHDFSGDGDIDEITSGLSGFLNRVLDLDMVMVLQEVEGGVRGSLRTNCNDIDVAKIAAEYGGGGHPRAAGFTCKGKIAEKENEWGVEGLEKLASL